MMNAKLIKRIGKFAMVVVMTLSLGTAVLAASDGDLVFDNYNRTDLGNFTTTEGGNVSGAAWTGGDATIENGALKINYTPQFWFGSGGGIDPSTYKYIVLKVKGAAGGEGAQFNLNFADSKQTVLQAGKTFSDLTGKAITTEYQEFVIDLAANNLPSDLQTFHFNFGDGTGTIYIDEIYFTNNPPAAAPASGGSLPQTGGIPTELFLLAGSGLTGLGVMLKSRKK